MSGFIMQVGGPLQSWGEHSAFNDRDTVAHPTRSGLIGLIASALGIPRDQAVGGTGDRDEPTLFERLGHLRFTVRHDRPGTRVRDYHTIGGGLPAHRTVPTAKGGRRGAGQTTIISHRHYLADAVFTIAVTAPEAPDPTELTTVCAAALAAPRWPLYLGRRSCPPGAPLVVATQVSDPVSELLTGVPLARVRPRTPHTTDREATVPVRFTADAPFPVGFPVTVSSRASVTSLNDEPVRLTQRDRVYRSRPSYAASCRLPADLCKGYGPAYLDELIAYLRPPAPQEADA
ncbi:type I-E CRISPR-associated protein Cas5/CasD [Streptomyces sp. UNOC14_S4]|uniref:type I-E CRISPR-associated protein Cas5/CasD n=1 Tax=Streptomyces sp. UNOC14_S4 TaxID=2872340 RepID=UPI001E397146|nr:type I-E CRISPR-associated protein Cas5/CasD [Streptomyces sp. UNOC14_S4]MCC3768637.1 type I-E CRISPR-associated protein Cas5/CasD [Streptomyces sp. UNOC14_S4]